MRGVGHGDHNGIEFGHRGGHFAESGGLGIRISFVAGGGLRHPRRDVAHLVGLHLELAYEAAHLLAHPGELDGQRHQRRVGGQGDLRR